MNIRSFAVPGVSPTLCTNYVNEQKIRLSSGNRWRFKKSKPMMDEEKSMEQEPRGKKR